MGTSIGAPVSPAPRRGRSNPPIHAEQSPEMVGTVARVANGRSGRLQRLASTVTAHATPRREWPAGEVAVRVRRLRYVLPRLCTKSDPVKDRIGDIVARLSGWAVARARLVIVMSWVIAIGCGLLASQLDVFGDFSSLLPPNTESVKHLRALERRTRVLALAPPRA
jgi:hypothetical protein